MTYCAVHPSRTHVLPSVFCHPPLHGLAGACTALRLDGPVCLFCAHTLHMPNLPNQPATQGAHTHTACLHTGGWGGEGGLMQAPDTGSTQSTYAGVAKTGAALTGTATVTVTACTVTMACLAHGAVALHARGRVGWVPGEEDSDGHGSLPSVRFLCGAHQRCPRYHRAAHACARACRGT